MRIVPHSRTLRKVREQVKYMVIDGTSSRRTRNYLHRWVMWWAMTSETWQYQELLQWFIDVCWHEQTAARRRPAPTSRQRITHPVCLDCGCCCISSASLKFLFDKNFANAPGEQVGRARAPTRPRRTRTKYYIDTRTIK